MKDWQQDLDKYLTESDVDYYERMGYTQMDFSEWFDAVDREIIDVTDGQLDANSIVSWPSRQWFEENKHFEDAAYEALLNDPIGADILSGKYYLE